MIGPINKNQMLKVIGNEILNSIESKIKTFSYLDLELDTPKLISSDIQQVEANGVKVDQFIYDDPFYCATPINNDKTVAVKITEQHKPGTDKRYLIVDLRFSVELINK